MGHILHVELSELLWQSGLLKCFDKVLIGVKIPAFYQAVLGLFLVGQVVLGLPLQGHIQHLVLVPLCLFLPG